MEGMSERQPWLIGVVKLTLFTEPCVEGILREIKVWRASVLQE